MIQKSLSLIMCLNSINQTSFPPPLPPWPGVKVTKIINVQNYLADISLNLWSLLRYIKMAITTTMNAIRSTQPKIAKIDAVLVSLTLAPTA